MLVSRAQTQQARVGIGPSRQGSVDRLRPLRQEHAAQLASWQLPHNASTTCVAVHGASAATEAEAAANEKRREEAGGAGSSDEWRWTLNWDKIEDNITVGSCPRSASDVDRLVDEAGVNAIICLQSDVCHEALQIGWDAIRQRAIEREVVITRVAVRDFDHGDQALMLPEAVRMLHLLLSMGKSVYVHCTAGINRATLTVVGYLTFVKGWQLDDARGHVKARRPQAHPYIDCWQSVRGRMLEGRTEELMGLAKAVYRGRQAEGRPGSSTGDWAAAERLLLQETFTRGMGCSLSLVSALKDLQEGQLNNLVCMTGQQVDVRNEELAELQAAAVVERNAFKQAQQELTAAREEVAMLRQAAAADEQGNEMLAELDALKSARAEIAALRSAIQQVARTTMTALEGEVAASIDSPSHPAAFLDVGAETSTAASGSRS